MLIKTVYLGRVGAIRIYRHDSSTGIPCYSIKVGCLRVVDKLYYTQLKPEHQLAVARVRLNKL